MHPSSKPTPSVFSRRKITGYFYDKLTGTFMGFLVAMSATSIVAHFFETKSVRNLWGLAAKKTVVDKKTFSMLEWFISIVIGFLVFEVMTNVVKKKLDQSLPRLRMQIFRWIVRNRYHTNLRMAFSKR